MDKMEQNASSCPKIMDLNDRNRYLTLSATVTSISTGGLKTNAKGRQDLAFTIGDDSGQMKAIAFHECAIPLYPVLKIGQRIKIINGCVKKLRVQNNNYTSSFQIEMNQNSKVELTDDDGTHYLVDGCLQTSVITSPPASSRASEVPEVVIPRRRVQETEGGKSTDKALRSRFISKFNDLDHETSGVIVGFRGVVSKIEESYRNGECSGWEVLVADKEKITRKIVIDEKSSICFTIGDIIECEGLYFPGSEFSDELYFIANFSKISLFINDLESEGASV